MREKLIELLIDGHSNSEKSPHYYGEPMSIDYQRFADYLLANGIVALPCGIDDPVFVIPTKENGRKEITPMACLGFVIGEPCNVANCFDEKNKLYQPSFDAFGKTVFLTHEEAEAALERSQQ